MSKTAEILAVGTELLLGNIANTDAQFISQELSALGNNVYTHTVVGDNPERVMEAAELARSRSDIVITTGGLGPTTDDLTKENIAKAFGRELYFDEPSAAMIRSWFESKRPGRQMTENNLRQAMLPVGCIVLENGAGTAPGCIIEDGDKTAIMLPGPPRECQAMWYSGVKPYLEKLSDCAIVSRNIRVFGIGESAIETRLGDIIPAASTLRWRLMQKRRRLCCALRPAHRHRRKAIPSAIVWWRG
jgi:nicotinamide-nucleotide amidase